MFSLFKELSAIIIVSRPLQRAIHSGACLSAGHLSAGTGGYAGVNGQRRDSIPERVRVSPNSGWNGVCPNASYAVCLLGLYPDGGAPGTALGDAAGGGPEIWENAAFWQAPIHSSNPSWRSNSNLRSYRFSAARSAHLFVFANRICLSGLWGIKSPVLLGLSGYDGNVYFPDPFCRQIS